MIQLVLYKIVQICNLNCSYCYVYNKGDYTWKSRPKFAEVELSTRLGRAIRTHCQKNELDSFSVELHGGEPLLLGYAEFLRHIHALRKNSYPIPLNIFLQTNGTLLDARWLQVLDAAAVTISISLDGPPELADKYRVYHSGRGSTNDVLARIGNLRSQSRLFDELCHGALCVINPDGDGREFVDWFSRLNFRSIDFLLPDGNYASPPMDKPEVAKTLEFLTSAFDQWILLDTNAPEIRFFKQAVISKTGKRPSIDALGGDITTMCVLESNGAIGAHDVLRICGGEFTTDKEYLDENTLSRTNVHRATKIAQKLPDKCNRCPHKTSCHGGYLPHRFDGRSFDNPSWYCDVLFSFFEHVEKRLVELLPTNVWRTVETRDNEKMHASCGSRVS